MDESAASEGHDFNIETLQRGDRSEPSPAHPRCRRIGGLGLAGLTGLDPRRSPFVLGRLGVLRRPGLRRLRVAASRLG